MHEATWGRRYWPWFLVIVSVAFLTPEIFALCTNTANTLSDYAWHELHLSLTAKRQVHDAAWFLTQGAYITVAFWLLMHIWYQQFR